MTAGCYFIALVSAWVGAMAAFALLAMLTTAREET